MRFFSLRGSGAVSVFKLSHSYTTKEPRSVINKSTREKHVLGLDENI